MATINDIIVRAIKKIGAYKIGRGVPGEEMGDAFDEYKSMIKEWATSPLLRPFNNRETFTLTAGKGDYTIGNGGELNTVRPDKVVDAYVSSPSSNVDYILNISHSMAGYDALPIKDLQSIPTDLYYDSQYDLGRLYIYPVPPEAYTLVLESTKPGTIPTALTDEFIFPDEYENMVIHSLGVRLAPSYGIKSEDIADVVALAGQLVSQMKAKNMRIPPLVGDAGIRKSCDEDWWKSGLR